LTHCFNFCRTAIGFDESGQICCSIIDCLDESG
jgi:hypothetical protein